MRNTRYEGYEGPNLPRKAQMQRLRRVIEQELTQTQKEIFLAYYVQQKPMPLIAQERGICTSSVCRTLHRAEDRVRRCLRY